MTFAVTKLFNNIWQDYISVTPSAEKIHQMFGGEESVINDHVAYRTFNIDKVSKEKLAAHLTALGYEKCGDYNFEQKKLIANHFEHPNAEMPKVFISELLVEEFSPEVQKIIHRIVDSISEEQITAENFLYSGRSWELSSTEYRTLLAESEYAAWLAVWGYRANHFTVSINHLPELEDIEQVNTLVKEAGFLLNTSGGEIKGNESVKLEQSSTMADKIEVTFSDTKMTIPSCFYEFAKRYPLANGKLYTGFVAASADKIFESTNIAA